MAKIDVTVSVSKETHEVGQLCAKLVMALKAKKSLTQIAIEELSDLEKAVAGIQLVPAEEQEDLAAFIKALVNPMADIAGALLQKEAPAAPVAAPSA